jgi:hypothetical protein
LAAVIITAQILLRFEPRLIPQVSETIPMNGHQSTDLLCSLCSKPVDLTTDLNADETGKTVHQECYLDRLTGAETSRIRVA